MTKVNQSRIREALTAGTNVKEKGPPVADGILSVTPDTPEMLEWRSRSALDVAETSSTFLDDDDDGPKPHELYGKFTWKIENFSEISKRELRSNVFDVGSYKWYILVYPQGCDVCNHLSLFLCVADYDKLLPGWSHFAQFTIAVVNKDPKKSKYSDTLHRFCKKEHDWGWKKFMELSKVLDGFTVADTLVIKAQVQVILDKPSKPFRCLDPQYRRELVRVYLTNVEGICRRFCDDKKLRLAWARDEALSFRQFWGSLTPEQQRKYLTDKGEVILKAVVKQFFNEKEVTSTLVMDALYSGCKQIEEHSRTWLEGKCSDNAPVVVIKAERSTFTLCGDLMEIADRVQKDFIPAAKDDSKALQPNDGLTLRSGQDGDDYRRDSIERDEKRLAELGRKTIEMFVIAHIFCEKLEIAYREAEALKRQDQLIAEEFEMARLEESRAQAKAQADKEKKAKKKEKLKLKKEAEKVKREAEESERKAREEEARRQEAERRAEAERKRLEDAQAQSQGGQQPQQQQQQQQQQQHGRKGNRSREEKRAVQAAAQQLQQQQQAAKARQQQQRQQADAAAAASSAGVPSQQAVTASSNKTQVQPSQRSLQSERPVALPLPTLSALAAAAVADSATSAAAASSAASTAAAPAPAAPSSPPEPSDAEELSPSDSGSDEEVGTVDQATGRADTSGDGEDDAEAGTGSGPGAPGGSHTESDGASDSDGGRAALEEEVTLLRAHVVQLQKLLAERDAELFALRAQLAELQPSELADMVKDGPGAPAPAQGPTSSAARAGSSLPSTSSMGNIAAAAEGAAPSSSVALGSAESGGCLAVGAAGRLDADRAGRGPETALANGPKEGLAPASISPSAATTASVAAAAVRRMQQQQQQQALGLSGGGPGPSHDPSALLHQGAGAVPTRPAGTGLPAGPTGMASGPSAAVVAAAAAAAAAATGRVPGGQQRSAGISAVPSGPAAAGEAVAHQAPQAQAGPAAGSSVAASSGENHVAAATTTSGPTQAGAVLMQRSTSATLPAIPSTSTPAAAGAPGSGAQYPPLASHQLTAAVAAAATANGRSRAGGASLDSASAAAAPAAVGAGPAAGGAQGSAGSKAAAAAAAGAAAPQFLAPAAATTTTPSVSANGIGGVMHTGSTGPAAAADGLPSYRNAAAGVLASGQPGGSISAAAASGIVGVSSTAPSMMPVSPTGAAGGGCGVPHKRVEDGPAAATAASAARHMGHSAAAAAAVADAAGFSAASARMMMQQAQRAGLASFGTPPVQSASAKRMAAAAQLDSPGLEDFAHINMIDDLLTE